MTKSNYLHVVILVHVFSFAARKDLYPREKSQLSIHLWGYSSTLLLLIVTATQQQVQVIIIIIINYILKSNVYS